MARNLGAAIIELLEHERADLRLAAATVLAEVGGGDEVVARALAARLADPDLAVRRIALDAVADRGLAGLAPALVGLVRGDDPGLAERAAALLAREGAAAEATLRREVGAGAAPARRTLAQLLLRRGTTPAVEAVLAQLADPDVGELALQLVRAELDAGDARLAALVEKLASARAVEAGRALARAWTAASGAARSAPNAKPARPAKPAKPAKPARPARPAKPARPDADDARPDADDARPATGIAADPLRDPAVAAAVPPLAALLRLLGYLARPTSQALLLDHAGPGQPRPIRLAAIAALRRLVAAGEARAAEPIVEALIGYADGDDPAVAQAAVDTLRGARIPERLARPFAALARSTNAAAQKLAMERLPAGGGPAAIKALVEALGGDDPAARDAAARGLARAPEAVPALVRALLAATDEAVARRYAGALRAHRGHVAPALLEELVEKVRGHLDLHARQRATGETILLERALGELLAELSPTHHVALLFERARRLRKAGKPVEAFGSLKPLLRTRAELDAAIDDDQRFLLAVLALEAAGDGILRAARTDDPVFEQFARLAARGYPVARKLAREKDVADDAIYALGFRLLEGGGHGAGVVAEVGEELGAELLRGIIDERPRSKLARAARNKLRLTGHLDEA